MKSKGIEIIITIALGFVAFKVVSMLLGGLKKLGEGFNIVTGGESDEEKETIINNANTNFIKWFNPVYGFTEVGKKYNPINNYYDKIAFNSNLADQIAKNIYNSKGLLNDIEVQTYNAFARIPTLGALSLVAHRFNILYPLKGGLINYLNSFLRSSEIKTIYTILAKKPTL